MTDNKFTRGPCSWINANASEGRLGRLFGHDALVLDADPGIFGKPADARLITAAFNSATKIADMGLDAQAAIEKLPDIVAALEQISALHIGGPHVGAQEGMNAAISGYSKAQQIARAAIPPKARGEPVQ